jgi:hypothetical protein
MNNFDQFCSTESASKIRRNGADVAELQIMLNSDASALPT